ncbi:MAG: TetR/AcrR family transcriptional regulator [Rhodoglobus sp.]
MGRSQSFESATVVQRARDVFWDKGFDATSISDLEEATGLGRSSLYHAFGNKHGLFDAAVDDYLRTVIRPRIAPLLSGSSGPALVEYFTSIRLSVESLPDDSPRRGCLLVNCATGLAGHDEAARAAVDAYRAELTAALRHALASSDTSRALTSPDELDTRARLLAALSISAMVIARVNRSEAVAMLSIAVDRVQSWT